LKSILVGLGVYIVGFLVVGLTKCKLPPKSCAR